jgi:predicted dinucleotide-binding enzyme
MECIAILGAGELGATLARLVAEVVIPFAYRDLLKELS